MLGEEIFDLANRLWPINRSITGDGVRETLAIIREFIPDLRVTEVPTGTNVFDWTVPHEWNVNNAYIKKPNGDIICNFKENNLHLVGYSVATSGMYSLQELQKHLYSLPDQPNAIPYVTSYYEDRWGFCLSENERNKLVEGNYEVVVDTVLKDGAMSYGELLIPGNSDKEIFLSTYICHPSMANNELSGPCVTTFIAKWLLNLESRKYSYRIVFVPETIGSIAYICKNIEAMKKNIFAGFNISCVGDNRDYSYLPSRDGQTISDKVAKHTLKYLCPSFKSYTWGERGSDERQYCSPGVDLPIASIMRTKYGKYNEYHTSLDTLGSVVTAEGLEGGFNAISKAITVLENNCYPKVTVLCEPQMGKRGLYPTLSKMTNTESPRLTMNILTWSDGRRSLMEIADLCGEPLWQILPIFKKLREHGLIEVAETSD